MCIMKALVVLGCLLASSPVAAAQAADPLESFNRPLASLLAGAHTASDHQHTPRIQVPHIVEMANEVMVTVSVPLVGDEKHYIRRLILIDENSMVQVKYVATFSPQARPVQVTATIKMAKNSRIKAIAECSLHGKWLGVSEPIQVGLGGCGVFPDQHRPRVLWLGIEKHPALELLANDVERAVAPFGFESELRPFQPHLTLGRAEKRARPGDFRGLDKLVARVEFAAVMPVASVDLMQSVLGRGSPIYTVLHRAVLQPSAPSGGH